MDCERRTAISDFFNDGRIYVGLIPLSSTTASNVEHLLMQLLWSWRPVDWGECGRRAIITATLQHRNHVLPSAGLWGFGSVVCSR